MFWGKKKKVLPVSLGFTFGKRQRWHHQLNGHEFEQILGDSEGRGCWLAAVHGLTKSRI